MTQPNGSISILDQARSYITAGFSVIPIRTDGSKKPAVPTWEEFKSRFATDKELSEWFPPTRDVGIAIVCGAVSGNLVVVDIETQAAWEEWRAGVERAGLQEVVDRCPIVKPPKGGRHIYCRIEEGAVPGAKLAMAAKNVTTIELRGEGNYVLAPGCPPSCHPLNLHYELVQRGGIGELSTMALNTFADLCAIAREQNIYVPPDRVRTAIHAPSDAKGDRPGDRFNSRAQWSDILERHGWKVDHTSGDTTYWTRPGKSRGVSATTGHCKSEVSGDLLYVFSSNADPFESETAYDKFGAYTLLEHKGDFSAASKQAYQMGFRKGETRVIWGPVPVAENRTEEKKSRWPDPIPISELNGQDATTEWLWKGCIARRHVTLCSALMKCGKSTLIGHLLRALQDGSPFVGLETQKCRTLVVSEESTTIWRARRDSLGLDDSIAVMCRPMLVKPTIGDWADFLAHVRKCAADKYDLVVIDTLSAFAPWENENSAADVQATLTPLNQLTEAGLAVMPIHHIGKVDGSEGRAARGSTALAAGVDILLELRRLHPTDRSDRRRVLTGLGRFDEVPEELVMALAEDGSGYTAEGEKREVTKRDINASLLAVLPNCPPGISAIQLHEGLPEDTRPGRGVLTKALLNGAKSGLWNQGGAGAKGDAFRFWTGKP